MRFIINYIRSCFCKHDWEFLTKVNAYDEFSGNMPASVKRVYRCRKCGFVQRVRL